MPDDHALKPFMRLRLPDEPEWLGSPFLTECEVDHCPLFEDQGRWYHWRPQAEGGAQAPNSDRRDATPEVPAQPAAEASPASAAVTSQGVLSDAP